MHSAFFFDKTVGQMYGNNSKTDIKVQTLQKSKEWLRQLDENMHKYWMYISLLLFISNAYSQCLLETQNRHILMHIYLPIYIHIYMHVYILTYLPRERERVES